MKDILVISSNCQYYKDGSFKQVDINLINYLEKASLSYGSSIKGRMESFKYLTNCHYKPALIISNQLKLYFIMTRSLSAKDCILINYQALRKYHALDMNKTLLIFKNGLEYIVDVNYRIIKRQDDLINIYENKLAGV